MSGAQKHITSDRAWALIMGESQLTSSETDHLKGCDDCKDFLDIFIKEAKAAGFKVASEFPSI